MTGLRIRAARIHPVTAPSFEDGAVLVDGAGRIAAVGPHASVPQPAAAQPLHFPDAELMPGLVNCHTHLELTHLGGGGGGGGRHDESEFLTWIRRIRELKEATSAEAFYEAAVAGVRDCWTRGVTCVAETGSTGAVMRALHDLGGRGIVYNEVLPIAVHAAESQEETLLVRDGAGPFAAALRARGIAIEARNCSPVAYLLQRGILRPGTLCIHCVQVDQADIELLRVTRAAVAHCPRSNAAHRHGRLPLRWVREAGVPGGLGTDSVVRVGELDLWAEAEAAGLTGGGDAALRMLTIEGARALGWEREIGSLEVGKAADLAVFPLAAPRRPSPPLAAQLTVVSGRIVHQISAP